MVPFLTRVVLIPCLSSFRDALVGPPTLCRLRVAFLRLVAALVVDVVGPPDLGVGDHAVAAQAAEVLEASSSPRSAFFSRNSRRALDAAA